MKMWGHIERHKLKYCAVKLVLLLHNCSDIHMHILIGI